MTMEISQDELNELLSCIESLAGMMERYYSQCGGADEAYEILEKYRRKQPYNTTEELIGASCKICGKTFKWSRKKRLLGEHQQNSALSNHLTQEHGIVDYKEKKQYKIKARVVVTHWDTYQDYLDSLNRGHKE